MTVAMWAELMVCWMVEKTVGMMVVHLVEPMVAYLVDMTAD